MIQRLTTDLRPGEYEELIRACSEVHAPTLPMGILGILNDPGGIEAATAILDEPSLDTAAAGVADYQRRAAAYRYLRTLGPEHTLPLARDWIRSRYGRAAAACDIFALHAKPEDVPAVRAGLEAFWPQRRISWVCDLIKALSRHPDHGPFPELPELFTSIEYAYARWRVAELMAASDPAFATTFARECLWDSEEGAQDAGIGVIASRDREAVLRIEEISAQRLEDAAVRERVRAQQGW